MARIIFWIDIYSCFIRLLFNAVTIPSNNKYVNYFFEKIQTLTKSGSKPVYFREKGIYVEEIQINDWVQVNYE